MVWSGLLSVFSFFFFFVCSNLHLKACEVSNTVGDLRGWGVFVFLSIPVKYLCLWVRQERYEACYKDVWGFSTHTHTLAPPNRMEHGFLPFGCHGNDRCSSWREGLQVWWAVWKCCVTSRASPNLVPVYCLFPQTYLLGIIISICGNVLISISLNIQVGSAGMRHSAQSTYLMPERTYFFCFLSFAGLPFSCQLATVCVDPNFSEHTPRNCLCDALTRSHHIRLSAAQVTLMPFLFVFLI